MRKKPRNPASTNIFPKKVNFKIDIGAKPVSRQAFDIGDVTATAGDTQLCLTLNAKEDWRLEFDKVVDMAGKTEHQYTIYKGDHEEQQEALKVLQETIDYWNDPHNTPKTGYERRESYLEAMRIAIAHLKGEFKKGENNDKG